jgi:crossover junction endodeoxyribonuclease RuvC
MVKIIGIDPGLSATGIGIVRGLGAKIDSYSFGSIHTSKTTSLPSRLDKIFSKLLQLLKSEKPDLMVIEDVYSLNRYPKSGILLGQVTGVIQLAGFHAAVTTVEVPVREAKQILTGNGNASKEQLEKAVRHRLNHKTCIKPVHASDAAGLALIGLYRYQDKVRMNINRM